MKTAVTSEPEGGGAAYLKAILEMKQRKGHLSPIARDCGASVLDARYDEGADLLRSTRRGETLSLAPAGYPGRWNPGDHPPVPVNKAGELSIGSRPVKPEPPSLGKVPRAPGWAD
jgi:hypothetical protein